MHKRTSQTQQAGAVRSEGDASWTEVLAQALAKTGRVERLTHGFHTYPAGLHPDAAGLLLDTLQPRRLLDPFAGGGTTLVEGLVRGCTVLGRDLSPVASLVSTARTSVTTEAQRTQMRSAARKMTERARHTPVPVPHRIGMAAQHWYAPHVMAELASLRHDLRRAPEEVSDLLWAAFSSLLVKVSWRKSDTSKQRVEHDRPPGTTAVLFHKKVRELGRRLEELEKAVPDGTPAVDLAIEDARDLTVSEPVDAVLTSPPYPGTYDYVRLQHLRHIWLGIDQSYADEHELGTRRAWRESPEEARRQWLQDTVAWTSRVSGHMAAGAHLVVVIGDGWAPSGPIEAAGPTRRAMELAGLQWVASSAVQRPAHGRAEGWWEHAIVARRS